MMNPEVFTPMTTDQVAAYADATAVTLNLGLSAGYREGVIAHLERLLQMGGQVMNFPLPDDAELAPVFRP
jgi:hypothetical protein